MTRRRERATTPVASAAPVTAPLEGTPLEERPAPPAKHPLQLALSCALMLAWILFLATMAWGVW